jgi:hypothetical protein
VADRVHDIHVRERRLKKEMVVVVVVVVVCVGW